MGIQTLERDILVIQSPFGELFVPTDSLLGDLCDESKRVTIQRLKKVLVTMNGQCI